METEVRGLNPETMQEPEEIFRLLVDTIDEYAIFVLDPLGYILTWNAGAERLKGYKAEEIIGSHFGRFYTASDLERNHPTTELEIARKMGKYEEEGWRLRKDGSKFWANIIITALRGKDGSLRGFGKITRDLTRRRESELALKQSEERFRLMVDGVQDYAIFMLDTKGNTTTWNKGAERNTGYSAQEVIGKHFSIFYSAEDQKAGRPQLELGEAVRDGRVEDEGWRIRKDGSCFWANVIITAIYDDNARLIGFAKVTRNLTERRQAEESLRSAYAELEHKIEERTESLSAAIRARDQFFSMASHELKTPLFSLKLQAQIRQRNIDKGKLELFTPEKLHQLFAEDDKQIDRLSALVERMLDISRLTSGNLDLSLENVPLYEMLTDIIKQTNPILAQTKNEIYLTAPTDVTGTWDRLRLEQVLTNLLTNAGKYAPGKPVLLNARCVGERVVIEVQDLGPGISLANQTRIFEPFERANNGSEVQGLGLGLYIARRIVERHGGQLTVRSILGQGSTFTIEIPLHSKGLKG